jgi:hypothetical protein
MDPEELEDEELEEIRSECSDLCLHSRLAFCLQPL